MDADTTFQQTESVGPPAVDTAVINNAGLQFMEGRSECATQREMDLSGGIHLNV